MPKACPYRWVVFLRLRMLDPIVFLLIRIVDMQAKAQSEAQRGRGRRRLGEGWSWRIPSKKNCLIRSIRDKNRNPRDSSVGISRRLGEWVWGVVRLLRLLRLTQIPRDSTKITCEKFVAEKNTYLIH